MNTPVSFPIAKLLKEKEFGINKKYQNYYIENHYYNEDGDLIECQEQSGSLSLFEDKYSAPTIAEVVMWLFESHNIWIYLTREPITNTFGPVINTETKSIYFNNQSTVSRVTGQKYDPWYNKPENGYQKAIEYVLTEMI